MASFTPPRTWTTGPLAAADLNADVRDNEIWIKDALTTHGITSDTTPQALLSGHHGVSLSATGIAITSASDTSLAFTSEVYDDVLYHDNAVNTDRITAPVTGRFEFKGQASFAAHATGRRALWFEVDGSTAWVRVDATSFSGNSLGMSR